MATNIGESVNGRLRNLARQRGEDMMALQTRYCLERFLWRLTQTSWGDRIALKGALIFVAHFGDVHRPTSDIDINGYGTGTAADLSDMVREAACVPCDDGVEFLADTIDITKERDWSVIGGGKVALDARIHTSLIRIRVDAGFGNVVTPEALEANYPSILSGMPSPRVRIYPLETMIAEKVDAMARHGAETTRLRDYYDLWSLSERRSFEGSMLAQALTGTFAQVGRKVPCELDALSDDFIELSSRQWDRFRRGKGLKFRAPDLEETVQRLRTFLGPALQAAAGSGSSPGRWVPGEGWSGLGAAHSLPAAQPDMRVPF